MSKEVLEDVNIPRKGWGIKISDLPDPYPKEDGWVFGSFESMMESLNAESEGYIDFDTEQEASDFWWAAAPTYHSRNGGTTYEVDGEYAYKDE